MTSRKKGRGRKAPLPRCLVGPSTMVVTFRIHATVHESEVELLKSAVLRFDPSADFDETPDGEELAWNAVL